MKQNKTGLMLQNLEQVGTLQTKASCIKKWLVDKPTADMVAINEQRSRLKEILNQIIQKK